MAKDDTILNFSEPAVKRLVIAHIKSLQGLYWFECRRVQSQHTKQQNAWYFGMLLPAIRQGMINVWGDDLTIEHVDRFLKWKFLSRTVQNRNTGQIMGVTFESPADLDIAKFSAYIDQIVTWATAVLHIEVPKAKHDAVTY